MALKITSLKIGKAVNAISTRKISTTAPNG
ncbi:MAG: hypothetical protein ACI9CE_000848 [Flavobacterium sp.]|jgi:hypothetical protein